MLKRTPKKRKIAVPVKRSASTKAVDAAKGLKRSLSNALISASKGRKSIIKKEPGTPKAAEKFQNGSGRGKKQTYSLPFQELELDPCECWPAAKQRQGQRESKGSQGRVRQ